MFIPRILKFYFRVSFFCHLFSQRLVIMTPFFCIVYFYQIKHFDYSEEIEDELSWDDIQRLAAAFVVCVLGTAAHKGN